MFIKYRVSRFETQVNSNTLKVLKYGSPNILYTQRKQKRLAYTVTVKNVALFGNGVHKCVNWELGWASKGSYELSKLSDTRRKVM